MNTHTTWLDTVVSHLNTAGLAQATGPVLARSSYDTLTPRPGLVHTHHLISASHVQDGSFTLVQAWWYEEAGTVSLYTLYGPRDIRFTADGTALEGQDWFMPDLTPEKALEVFLRLVQNGAAKSHLCN